MQDRWDAGKGGMQERRETGIREAGQEGGRTGGREERREAEK